MGGRGTFSEGKIVPYQYEVDKSATPTGTWEGVKILKGIEGTGKHGLPESSHSSNAYIKLDHNGVFREMRFYDNNHVLYLEIGYHGEYSLTGDRNKPVLHYHVYDENFSRSPNGHFERSKAAYLTEEMMGKYKKYFKGVSL